MRRETGRKRSISGALFLALTLTVLGGGGPSLVQEPSETPQGSYVCPPCGHPCDRDVVQGPGKCPNCSMTLIERSDLLNVAVVLHPMVEAADLVGPMRAFQASAGFYVYTVAPTNDPVVTRELLEIKPQFNFEHSPQPDVIVISGGDWRAIEDAALVGWLGETGAKAEKILGLGGGAVILAKAGLLQNGEAAIDSSARGFLEWAKREGKLETDAVFHTDRKVVESGKVWSSPSAEGGLEAALGTVSKLLGPSIARKAAERLRVDWNPQ